jgi:hypothetical protein
MGRPFPLNSVRRRYWQLVAEGCPQELLARLLACRTPRVCDGSASVAV